jgi:hypothetical protein
LEDKMEEILDSHNNKNWVIVITVSKNSQTWSKDQT